MNRHERIVRGLQWAVEKGIIRDWQSQSMMPGHRWTLIGFGFTDRAYSTSEVEIFLLGASEGRTSAVLNPPPTS